jgi:hypothetical protein
VSFRTHQKDSYVMAITVAEKVLIAGGVLNLAYGVVLGYAIVVNRVRGAPATPRYLMAAHIGTLLQAAVLLGLVWAARLSALGPAWNEVAAWRLRQPARFRLVRGSWSARSPGSEPQCPVPLSPYHVPFASLRLNLSEHPTVSEMRDA